MKLSISKYGNKSRPSGWHNEQARHSLAAKGIKTGRINYAKTSSLTFEPQYARQPQFWGNLSAEGQLSHLDSELNALIVRTEHFLKSGITKNQKEQLDNEMVIFVEKTEKLKRRAEQENNEKVEYKAEELLHNTEIIDKYKKLKVLSMIQGLHKK